jgi:hypothetical protein
MTAEVTLVTGPPDAFGSPRMRKCPGCSDRIWRNELCCPTCDRRLPVRLWMDLYMAKARRAWEPERRYQEAQAACLIWFRNNPLGVKA